LLRVSPAFVNQTLSLQDQYKSPAWVQRFPYLPYKGQIKLKESGNKDGKARYNMDLLMTLVQASPVQLMPFQCLSVQLLFATIPATNKQHPSLPRDAQSTVQRGSTAE